MKKLLTVLLLCSCILGCKDKKPISRRYAVIPIIEYVDKDTFIVSYKHGNNAGVTGNMAVGFGTRRITTIQHSYDTVWIGEKKKGAITSIQYVQ